MSKKIKRLGIYMPAELHKRMQYASIMLEKSMTKMAVEAIEEYLNKEVVEGVTALERPPKFSVEVDIDD